MTPASPDSSVSAGVESHRSGGVRPGPTAVGGVATNLVVESAARHACDAGLSVTVVDDLCASFRADFHDFSMQNLMPLFGTVTGAGRRAGLDSYSDDFQRLLRYGRGVDIGRLETELGHTPRYSTVEAVQRWVAR